MKHLVFISFLLSTISVISQHTTITDEDFNLDGIADHMKCTYEIGHNFGGSTCDLIDGKTNIKYTLHNKSCFFAMKSHVNVDKDLRKKENKYFFYKLKTEILPKFSPIADQSLLWIINSTLHTTNLTNNTHFDYIFNPKTTWRSGQPTLPYTYYIEIKEQTISKIINTQHNTEEILSKDHKDFLVYYGDTHFLNQNDKKFELVTENSSYQILKTAHGVIAKKGKTYKWLFVTDIDANDAPRKLRWASIDTVILQNNYVIIKQNLAPDRDFNLYLINIENGIGAKLKIDLDKINFETLSKTEQLSFKNDTLYLGKKENLIEIPLQEVKKALDVLVQK